MISWRSSLLNARICFHQSRHCVTCNNVALWSVWGVRLPACTCLWSAHTWRCSWRCRDGWTQEEDPLLSLIYRQMNTLQSSGHEIHILCSLTLHLHRQKPDERTRETRRTCWPPPWSAATCPCWPGQRNTRWSDWTTSASEASRWPPEGCSQPGPVVWLVSDRYGKPALGPSPVHQAADMRQKRQVTFHLKTIWSAVKDLWILTEYHLE